MEPIHIRKSDFLKTVLQLRGTGWPDISRLGYDKWFYFCRKTGRMWILPLKFSINGGQWIVPMSNTIPHYRNGEFLGWGSVDEVTTSPTESGLEFFGDMGKVSEYQEVMVDDGEVM